MKVHCCVDAMVQNLKDAGCDEVTIQAFMSNLQKDKPTSAIQLLQKHRRSLLCCLHEYQKQIDCLDYFLFMLQKQNK